MDHLVCIPKYRMIASFSDSKFFFEYLSDFSSSNASFPIAWTRNLVILSSLFFPRFDQNSQECSKSMPSMTKVSARSVRSSQVPLLSPSLLLQSTLSACHYCRFLSPSLFCVFWTYPSYHHVHLWYPNDSGSLCLLAWIWSNRLCDNSRLILDSGFHRGLP